MQTILYSIWLNCDYISYINDYNLINLEINKLIGIKMNNNFNFNLFKLLSIKRSNSTYY